MSLFDNFCCKIGELISERQENPIIDKIVGGTLMAVGSAGYAASKVIHKAQGPIGHLINKSLEQDPIRDCMEDCKDLIDEGLSRFK